MTTLATYALGGSLRASVRRLRSGALVLSVTRRNGDPVAESPIVHSTAAALRALADAVEAAR